MLVKFKLLLNGRDSSYKANTIGFVTQRRTKLQRIKLQGLLNKEKLSIYRRVDRKTEHDDYASVKTSISRSQACFSDFWVDYMSYNVSRIVRKQSKHKGKAGLTR